MPGRKHVSGFLQGLICGGILGLAPLLWPGAEATRDLLRLAVPYLYQFWELLSVNLQGSAPLFAAVLVFYTLQLHRLRSLLSQAEPELERVARHEQLLDLCANLFFGVGVIWTAIGMRGALLHALGDPTVTASHSAFAVLQRLVDGGILLALSTTIVGGVGGYLMRAIKSIYLGRGLATLYMHAYQQPDERNLAALERIEGLLEGTGVDRRAGQGQL